MVVESARGKHSYWLLEPGEARESFSKAQAALAGHFQTDPTVKDLPRVMRVPGFLHQKNPASPFLVRIVETRPVKYTIAQVLAAFPGGISAANEARECGDARPGENRQGTNDLAVRRAQAYLAKIAGAIQGEGGDNDTYVVACVLVRDFGLSVENALELLREWNAKCTPPWSESDLIEKLQNADKYASGTRGAKLSALAAEFRGTEDLCFVVPLSRCFARNARGEWDTNKPLDEKGAKGHLRSLRVREKNVGNIMALHLMPIAHSVDCSPGDPPLFDKDGSRVVNSYRAPRIIPAPGDFPRIKAMIEAVADGNQRAIDWLFNWFAAKYQNPGSRSMTAVVAQGSQGIGKTKLALIFADLLGAENTASISQADIESSFNGHFASKLFVIADEVANRDTLRDSSSILKKYVTDPRLMVNVKSVPQYEIQNRMSWWFTSNSDTPVKVEGRGDRRYTVLSALASRTPEYEAVLNSVHGPDGSFTPDFRSEMAAFAYALRVHDVDYELARKPLDNDARDALIEATRSSAEAFWAEVAEQGIKNVVAEHLVPGLDEHWDCGEAGVTVDAVYRAYERYCDAQGMKACRRSSLGTAMRVAFPEADRRRGAVGHMRPWMYVGLPTSPRQP